MKLKNLFQALLACLLPCVLLGNNLISLPIVACSNPTNLAKNKSVTQVSTSSGEDADHAVDGNTNGNSYPLLRVFKNKIL